MTLRTPVFLDHHATTPIDPGVLSFLEEVQRNHFGNPASSGYAFGWAAARLVEEARKKVADLIGGTAREIIFTAGATEADNLALLGVAAAYGAEGGHLVTTNLEHEAVRGPVAEFKRRGGRATVVQARSDGRVTAADIAAALEDDTLLVSVMTAQNEIGTVQPVAEIGRICKRRGVLFHTDAAQAAGKIPLDVEKDGVDLLSLSAHKMYGPKGVGALYVRRRDPRVTLAPLQHGGGQERGLRPGTLNVPGIAAFGEACRVAGEVMPEEALRLRGLRDRMWEAVAGALEGVHLNGALEERLPGNLNVSFEGIRAHRLLSALTVIAVSSSSACSSVESRPSEILKAIGVTEPLAAASLRIGLGRFTTREEVDFATARIIEVVSKLRD
ncbi:MAG: cysteine desulfurase family protein [Candidatus Krumholzibacteriota bacterium]